MKKFKAVQFVLGLGLVFVLAGCESLQEASANSSKAGLEQPAVVSLIVDYASPGQAVNDLVFGTNIEWVDNGDSIWDDQAGDFSGERLMAIAQTHPTSIRFPGGVHADTYHWKFGVGDPASRPPGEHYYKTEKIPSHFGTDEFLKLCKRLNARPIFTLNIVSGTPEEAAEWVAYVNKATKANNYPRVLFWEVGNEPYLENKFVRLSSQEYAKVYLQYAQAIRRADPQAPLGALFVGLELEKQYRDKDGLGWNEALLRDAGDLIDYGSIHNAYYPGFIWNPFSSDKDVFAQTFRSLDKIREDFEWLKQMIGTRPIKLDVSEYNSFFGLNTRFDGYAASLGGGLYVANVIHVLAAEPLVGAAQYWSMLDNWYFGLVFAGKTRRPNFYVFKLYAQMQGKTRIPVSNPSEKSLKVMAVKDPGGGELLVYVINNDLRRSARLVLDIRGFQPDGQVTLQTLSADKITANNESGEEEVSIKTSSLPAADHLEFDISKHSLVLLKFKGR